jgi:CheY-like chemotaxis protein
MNTEASAPVGLLLCDDLIFTSRVTATARALGLAVRPARSADDLVRLAQKDAPRCVIVDLANPGLAVSELINRLRKSCSPMPLVVAYGSHVDAAGLHAAREAGCDVVWPRSKFVEELPRALPEWFRVEDPRGNAVSRKDKV